MAAEFNQVILLGRLTADPELRYLDSGTAVARLRVASNTTYTVNDEKREDVCFINVDAWGRMAETANQFLKKGRQVLIEGRLVYRTWETDNGEKRSVHEVRANTIQFLDRGDGASAEDGDAFPDERPARDARPSRPSGGGQSGGNRRPTRPPQDDTDDDIPF